MVSKTARHRARLPPEDRKSIILRYARILISELGYSQFLPSAVAERCGISEATVYRYFPSKRDLLVNVAEDWLEEIFSIRPDVMDMPDTHTRLQHVIAHSLFLAQQDPELTRFVLVVLRSDPNYRSSRIYELNRRYTSYVMNVVYDAISSGEFHSERSPLLIRDMIFGAIEHRIWTYLRNGEVFSISEEARGITDILFSGLCSTPAISSKAMAQSIHTLELAAATVNQELSKLRKGIERSELNTLIKKQSPQANEVTP